VIPTPLIYALKNELNRTLSSQAIDGERALARHAEEQACVAFHRETPVSYHRLALDIDRIHPDDLRNATNCKRPVENAEFLNDRLQHVHRYCQAYCGWLIQQNDFQAEVESFVNSHRSDLAEAGLPRPVFSVPKSIEALNGDQTVPVDRLRAICDKWRLQEFATIDLPRAIEPQYSVPNVYTRTAVEGGVAPFLPDTFPIEGTGPTANMLDNIRTNMTAPHLVEWNELTCSNSQMRTKIPSLARRFQLQHYWRVVTQRYTDELRRKRSKLYVAFATYFSVSKDTIERDVAELDCLLDRRLSSSL
jgi:hypothetical protein